MRSARRCWNACRRGWTRSSAKAAPSCRAASASGCRSPGRCCASRACWCSTKPTSALDSLTEQQVTETVRRVSEERTQITLLIAHRLSTVLHADAIYVLEKGRVVESGTHAELVALKGLYYAMWRQQIGERKPSISSSNDSTAPRADDLAPASED
jgi:hypothetical protein